MSGFTMFHLYLMFFLLGLGYAILAVLMGQLMGSHEVAGDGDVGGHEAGGFDADHDFDVAGHEPSGFDVDHDVDIGGHEAGGLDADHDVDLGGDADAGDAGAHDFDAGVGEAMPNISPLSPVTIATFATSFGGVGLVLDKAGLPAFGSVPIAGGSGFVVAVGVFYLFYRVFSFTQGTSGVAARHAVGRIGEIITAIPEGGTGEIAYILGGRRFNGGARTEDGHPVPKGASVSIVRQAGSAFIVRESVEERLKY